jgi:HEAT repeat protein
MASFGSGIVMGAIAGAAATGILMLAVPRRADAPPPPPPVAAPAPDVAAPLREENRRLAERVAELEKEKSAAPTPVEKKDEKAPASAADLKAEFAKLVEKGLGAFRDPKFADAVKEVKERGKPAIDFLMNALRTGATATERFLAAALLEGAGDASAVPALVDALKDKDDLVRRMASHALAVMGSPDAIPSLQAASTGDSDWGVRVNSAYGLAKQKNEDGLRLLREAYESSATPTEYRLAILGGLADVAAPSTAPLFRRILADTKDMSYLLMSIGALEKMKDAASIPALQVVADSTQPEVVKQAAAKAIETIRK